MYDCRNRLQRVWRGKRTDFPKWVTFVTVSEPPFLARFNIGYPQVIIIDKSYEVGVSRADLGVHTGSWALGLDLHRLYRSRLLKPTDTICQKQEGGGFIEKGQVEARIEDNRSVSSSWIRHERTLYSQWSRCCLHPDSKRGCCWPGRETGRSGHGSRKRWSQTLRDVYALSTAPLLESRLPGEVSPEGNHRWTMSTE